MEAIRPLVPADCAAVAELHLRCLPTDFVGTPGRNLLRRYYEAVAAGDGACGYVADEAGRVTGFICGVWDPAAVRSKLLRRSWPRLLAWGGAQVLVRPQLLLRRSSGRNEEAVPAYELRPIVVSPERRGMGTAVALVATLLQDARRRGFAEVHLLAYASDARAVAFYRKTGFREAGARERGGVRLLLFVQSTAGAP